MALNVHFLLIKNTPLIFYLFFFPLLTSVYKKRSHHIYFNFLQMNGFKCALLTLRNTIKFRYGRKKLPYIEGKKNSQNQQIFYHFLSFNST